MYVFFIFFRENIWFCFFIIMKEMEIGTEKGRFRMGNERKWCSGWERGIEVKRGFRRGVWVRRRCGGSDGGKGGLI